MYWKLVKRTDSRARLLADRHYSRKRIGAREFCPPGNNIVLIGLNDDALWVSHRPDPNANLSQWRQDGFNYWDNPYFRNESGGIASAMILEALAITVSLWGKDSIVQDGFHSFVDPACVTPVMVRGNPVFGWCYGKAGFVCAPELTKSRKLFRWIFSADQLRNLVPIAPLMEQSQLSL